MSTRRDLEGEVVSRSLAVARGRRLALERRAFSMFCETVPAGADHAGMTYFLIAGGIPPRDGQRGRPWRPPRVLRYPRARDEPCAGKIADAGGPARPGGGSRSPPGSLRSRPECGMPRPPSPRRGRADRPAAELRSATACQSASLAGGRPCSGSEGVDRAREAPAQRPGSQAGAPALTCRPDPLNDHVTGTLKFGWRPENGNRRPSG